MPSRTQVYRPDRPIVAELAGGAVVVQRADRTVLLLHETSEDRWCMPKGHVEPEESLRAAAEREVREETGLNRITMLGEVGEVSYRYFDPAIDRNVYKTTVYFLAITPEREVRPEALFDQFRWCTLRDALDLVRYPTDRQVLARAIPHLSWARMPGGSSS